MEKNLAAVGRTKISGDSTWFMDQCNSLFSPLVLTTDLVLLLGSEVVLDVEGLADLLGRLALDHVGDGLAAHVQQCLDIEVVGSLLE
jgi:hypothetical protein